MAKKKMLINRWPVGFKKKSGIPPFDYAWQFAEYLKYAVTQAVQEIALNISSAPVQVFGVQNKVGKMENTLSSHFAQTFSKEQDLTSALGINKNGLPNNGHANAFARHFTATTGKTTHMDYGNLVEQRALKLILEKQKAGNLKYIIGALNLSIDYDFLYNDPYEHKGRFELSYKGKNKSARPDFRVSLKGVYGDEWQGEEAIYDITSVGDYGHIKTKNVDGVTLDKIKKIVVGYEILYDSNDAWSAQPTEVHTTLATN